MVLGDHRLAEQRGGDRQAARLDQTVKLLHQAIAVQLDAAQDHRTLRRQEQSHRLVERLRERVGIGGRAARGGEGSRRGAGSIHHIGRNLDHDRPLLGDAAGERAVDPLRRLGGIIEQHGGDRDVGIGLLHGREVADAMVQQHGGAPLRGARTADEDDERHLLGIGAGDGVHGAEAADAPGDTDAADAVDPRIGVRRIAGIQLVAGADELDPRLRSAGP